MPRVIKVEGLGHVLFPHDMPDHEIAGHIAEHFDLPREDRIRGSADLPLTKSGRKDAEALGHHLTNCGCAFDRIASSPKKRTVETAKLISPHAQLELDNHLEDMKYGHLEGEKSKEAIPTINDHIINKPHEPLPGMSRFSGEHGESFNQYKGRMIPAVLRVIANAHPHEKTAIILNRRSMKTFQAWVAAGHKDSLETNPSIATEHKEGDIPNGSIWKIGANGLEQVEKTHDIGPGVYAMRHFQTHWNS